MLMAKIEKRDLQPIAAVLSPKDFAFIEQRVLELSAKLDLQRPKRDAEVFPEIVPHWHVIMVMPGKERSAADDLSDRCFGVYLPESEHTEVRRGRKVDFKRLMLPGYVFVFVWDIDRHWDRILACDGVRGILCINDKAAIVVDREVDTIREAENRERPLRGLVLTADGVKKKKRFRKSHKSEEERLAEQQIADNEIVSVHSYSPFIEALRVDAEGERLSAFHKAIGLAPCSEPENQSKRVRQGNGVAS